MSKPPFETIWDRIIKEQEKNFYTKTGLRFTYEIKRNGFYPSRTKYRISENNFEKAYKIVPIDGPGKISDTIRGPSYIWAVLHDPRISLGAW